MRLTSPATLTPEREATASEEVVNTPCLSDLAATMAAALVSVRNGNGQAQLVRANDQLFSSNGFHSQDASSAGTEKAAAWVGEQAVMMENNTPTMMLKCADCGICKNNSEDMEIHIKMEHLNWLPFQCPVCSCQRASDAQMREHLHSSHRNNSTLFHYVDNVAAKRRLQMLMDRSLSHAISRKINGRNGSISAPSGSNYSTITAEDLAKVSDEGGSSSAASPPAASSPPHASGASSAAASATCVVSSHSSRKRPHPNQLINTNTDAILANIQAATEAAQPEENSYMDSVLDAFFSKRVKSEFDVDEEDILDGLNVPSSSVLENVSALFSNDGRVDETGGCEEINYPALMKGALTKAAAAVAAASNNPNNNRNHTPSKKRVLGECSKCQKPVTAGARQMHMFFHLGKDHNIYRFRCKFPDCAVEHYRKDQMENHHSKQHGKIDPDMMEDRSLELFQKCQELSMELLGTNGSTPGPTAARALVAYNAQQAAAAAASKNGGLASSSSTVSGANRGGTSSRPKKTDDGTPNGIRDEDHPLECRLCHKTMQNRIRGFHILWHMAKDLGINRYTCQLCDFGHDRSQSVQTHGKREHGREDVVEDRIDEFAEEVKQMSEACFGFQALFSQDSRRRSKIPLAPKLDKPVENGDNEEDAAENDENESVPEGEDEDENEESRSSRKLKIRRFGARKAPTKEKRVEMAKLREVSLLIGGAQYFKKRLNDAAHCEKCGMLTTSRMSDHVYKHINAHLFCCPKCELGHYSREIVVRHIRDMHRTNDVPVDKRLQYAQEIKDMVRECYPAYFIDSPLPTVADIEKLKAHIGAEEFERIVAQCDTKEDEEDVDEEKILPISPKEEDEEGDEQPALIVRAVKKEESTASSGELDEEEDDGLQEEEVDEEDEEEEAEV